MGKMGRKMCYSTHSLTYGSRGCKISTRSVVCTFQKMKREKPSDAQKEEKRGRMKNTNVTEGSGRKH